MRAGGSAGVARPSVEPRSTPAIFKQAPPILKPNLNKPDHTVLVWIWDTGVRYPRHARADRRDHPDRAERRSRRGVECAEWPRAAHRLIHVSSPACDDTHGQHRLRIALDRCVIWTSDSQPEHSISVPFPKVVMHAISRDLASYPKPCLYCHIERYSDRARARNLSLIRKRCAVQRCPAGCSSYRGGYGDGRASQRRGRRG